MQDEDSKIADSFSDLGPRDWLKNVAALSNANGYFAKLGPSHFASLVDTDAHVLLVSFETMPDIRETDSDAHPMGWRMVTEHNWTSLSVVSAKDTWFRDEIVFDFFDQLTEDGFFGEFEEVIFYGAKSCAYAAAAFSAAAPGCKTVLVQPQATLSPDKAGWDSRFREYRRLNFNSRYGYAPEMSAAAEDVYVIFDPHEREDAMHAALFAGPNTTLLPTRFMGPRIHVQLSAMRLIAPILTEVAAGTFSRSKFAQHMRARRDYRPYLRYFLGQLRAAKRDYLIELMCRNVVQRMNAPVFARTLRTLEQAREEAEEQEELQTAAEG